MNGRFEDIKLSWNGRAYVIPSDKVMGAISRIEDVITLHELGQAQQRGSVPLGKLSIAYANVLRYAGANVTDDEVYHGMFGDVIDVQPRMVGALTGLLAMLVPPSVRNGTAPPVDEPNAGNVSPAAAASSSKRTKQRSDRSGSRSQSSGPSTQQNSGGS